MTALASVTYFVVVKRFFMDSSDLLNSGPGSYGFAYYYADLIPNGNGAQGPRRLAADQSRASSSGASSRRPKFEYARRCSCLSPSLPLAARPARTMLVYGAIFCLLASKPAVYSIAFQYSSVVLPLAFAVAIIALEQVPRWRVVVALGLDATKVRRSLFAFALTASALVSWKLGALRPRSRLLRGLRSHRPRPRRGRERAVRVGARRRSPRSLPTRAWPPRSASARSCRTGATPTTTRRRSRATTCSSTKWRSRVADAIARGQRVARGELELVARHQTLALYRAVKEPPAAQK